MKTIKLLFVLTCLINSAFASFDVTQETIYCHNTTNQKLNCNYQVGEGKNVYETSVSITGLAQYVIQRQKHKTVYARHILREGVVANSIQISEDVKGLLTKDTVKFVTPSDVTERPHFISLEILDVSSQADLRKEVQKIKDIVDKFNPAYQVKAENASAKN